ncbi:protein pxr1 [Prunus avium]|uniref:Protein pxr1 n=1 Tax=Prunus avium TaxID=42229 RepID=A0A6P5T5N3_PRUAV|nr:protein pxr1 [Prunus avium]
MGEDEPVTVGSSSSGIDSSNIGFQLLKKQGWTQGTGLGASQQGRLEPVKAYLKDNKRGLGADTSRNKFFPVSENSDSSGNYEKNNSSVHLVQEEEGMGKGMVASSCSAIAINPSNIGFQLLKKHGWKEGTGLGISEQGRIEPVQAYLKNNKRGLGADKLQKALNPPDSTALNRKNDQELHSKKGKGLSKKMKKEQELEKRLQEREFERAFYREFWPDNV